MFCVWVFENFDGSDACMALAAVFVNSTDSSLVRTIAFVLTLAGTALMSVYWGFCAGGVIFHFMPGFPIHVYGPHTTACFAFSLLHSTTGLGLEAMFAMVLLRDVCFTPLPPGPVPNELRHASQARRAKPALSLHTVVPPRLPLGRPHKVRCCYREPAGHFIASPKCCT